MLESHFKVLHESVLHDGQVKVSYPIPRQILFIAIVHLKDAVEMVNSL